MDRLFSSFLAFPTTDRTWFGRARAFVPLPGRLRPTLRVGRWSAFGLL